MRKLVLKSASKRMGGYGGRVFWPADDCRPVSQMPSRQPPKSWQQRRGKTKGQTRQIGRRAGLASSATLGWFVGGPVTAAAAVAGWAMGSNHCNPNGRIRQAGDHQGHRGLPARRIRPLRHPLQPSVEGDESVGCTSRGVNVAAFEGCPTAKDVTTLVTKFTDLFNCLNLW